MSTDLREAARAFTKAIDAWRTAPTKDERNNRLEDMWDAEQSLRDALAEDDGMVRVPREPTEAMHVAAVKTILRCHGNDDWPPRVWRAMLAVAEKETG